MNRTRITPELQEELDGLGEMASLVAMNLNTIDKSFEDDHSRQVNRAKKMNPKELLMKAVRENQDQAAHLVNAENLGEIEPGFVPPEHQVSAPPAQLAPVPQPLPANFTNNNGQNSPPTVPKQNIKPPAQRPNDDQLEFKFNPSAEQRFAELERKIVTRLAKQDKELEEIKALLEKLLKQPTIKKTTAKKTSPKKKETNATSKSPRKSSTSEGS